VIVSFPLADTLFSPPLFRPTEQLPHLSRSGMRHVKNAYQVLYATMEDMGYLVNRCPPERAAVVFDWSEKNGTAYDDRSRIIIEHGWLPRSSYQLSPRGTNARSHVATTFRLGVPTASETRYVLQQLAIMRRVFAVGGASAGTGVLQRRLREPFVFFPLQLATDFNLRYSNSPLAQCYSPNPEANVALAQACVDLVEEADLPLPVLFKQHPADRTALGQRLRFRDPRHLLIENTDATTSLDVLGSNLCRLVVSINSNTLHEALVFGLPVVALGSLLWQERPDARPFASALRDAPGLLGHDPLTDVGTISYLYQLFANQWYLSDFQNPLMVQALIEQQATCVPLELRRALGFGTSGIPG
jgi:hypothetical protein